MASGFGTGGLSGVGTAATSSPQTGGALKAGPGVTSPGAAPTGPIPQPGGFSFGTPQTAGFTGTPTGGGFGGFNLSPQQVGAGGQQAGFGGGFGASPRLLGRTEIQGLNQQLGIEGTPEAFGTNAFRARQQLGSFGFIADPTTFSRQQIPFIEARLNFENLLQAQADRQQAVNLLSSQRDVIGQSPEQLQALAIAQRRLAQPEPFTPEEVSQQQSAIRQRGAQGIEAAQRQQLESLARQGVAGGVTAFQEAGQRQQGARQVSDELQRLAIENALGRDVNEAQAIDRLQGITGQNELRQVALNQALSELLTAQRGEFDLSSLAGKERKAERGVLSKIGFF